MADVLLLRDRPEDAEQDAYTIELRRNGFSAHHISPLSSVLTNERTLAEIIARGATRRWGGAIFTSKRAVGAWDAAIRALAQGSKGKERLEEEGSGWDEVPFFAVGPATANSLASLEPSAFSPSRHLIVGGHDSGTGAALGSFIVKYYAPSSDARALPLLYLTGDKRSPYLPEALSSANPPIPFNELAVYATQPSSTIASDLSALLDSLRGDPPLRWLVLFSPSGGKVILPEIERRRLLPLRIAAIGPTTETWIKETLDKAPDAVATKPEPSSLVEAILEAERHAS